MSWKGYNHNVVLCLASWSLYSLADSIWNGTVFVTYLYVASGDSNTDVGYIEAAQGAAMLLTAYPVGYFADKYSRSLVIAWGGVSNFAAIATLAFTVINPFDFGSSACFWLLMLAMCLYGLGSGVINGPAQAIYADSLPTGDRSRWYLYLYVFGTLASVIGPLITVLGFIYWGNDWTLPELRNIILVGLAIEIPAAFSLFFFKDNRTLGHESDALNAVDEDAPPRHVKSSFLTFTVTEEAIPYLLFLGDLISSLASGMTIKFFALWFKNALFMNPVQVQTVFALSPLCIAIFSWGGQWSTAYVGRVWSVIGVSTIGVACLFMMVLLVDHVPVWTTICIYLLRTACMNCTYPIQEAILMDYVPKGRRARWKSLQSVASFGWCGSAMVGGIMADKYGYGHTFILTAILQGVATAIWLPLIGVVAEEERVQGAIPREVSECEPLVNWHVEDDGGRRLSVYSTVSK